MCNTQRRTKTLNFLRFGVLVFLGGSGLWTSSALAQCEPGGPGPDAVSTLQNVSGPPTEVFGCVNGFQAYFAEGGVCNVGTAPLPGDASTNQHAMMTQNLYRFTTNRFEQIGMSWVKHDDWTIVGGDPGCGSLPCTPCLPPECPDAPALGVGCRDTYISCLNGAQGLLGPRSQINAATGAWPVVPDPDPGRYCNASGSDAVIDCRLRVQTADLAPTSPPTQYFLEQQVITPDETSATTRNNNVSYKAASVSACNTSGCTGSTDCGQSRSCTTGNGCPQTEGGLNCVYPLSVSGTQFCQEPAIHAWKDDDSSVVETEFQVTGDGQFILAAKAWQEPNTCLWNYEYALYNMNSDRSAQAFKVPTNLSSGDVSNREFHGISYHSGEPYSDTAWSDSIASGYITWATQLESTNTNANALRWGTLYNFRFRAPRPPNNSATVRIDLFKSGSPSYVEVTSIAPVTSPLGACCNGTTCCVTTQAFCTSQSGSFKGVGTSCENCVDCDEDGICDICDSFGACCLNSTTCITTPSSDCCDAAGGTYWYGLGSKCRDVNCLIAPSGPQGP